VNKETHMQKTKALAATAPSWDRRTSSQLSSVRRRAQKAWSMAVREKRPLSMKHLRGLGCSSCDY
jgi:hypothetical protein